MKQESDGHRTFEATLTVGLPPFLQETYVSAVKVNPERLTVETVSISSQKFDSLASRWQLATVMNEAGYAVDDTKCAVTFEVEMTVSHPLIVGTLDRVLEQVAGRQVHAFATRCRQIALPPDLEPATPRQ